MKTYLHIAVLIVAAIAVVALAMAWRSARHDSQQLTATLSTQNAVLQQTSAREKQRDVQLSAALAAIAAQKRAVQTPRQAAAAIPSVLPPLPLPISIKIPDLSPLQNPADVPPAAISIPQADLKPLYDNLQDCRASQIENETVKKNLADETARAAALMSERDAALTAARGGSFWQKLKRGAKWFAIGATFAAGALCASGHCR